LPYKDGDTTQFTAFAPPGAPTGHVSFTVELKYLGSTIYLPLISDADVSKRLRAEAAAFGALRGMLRNFALAESLPSAVLTTRLRGAVPARRPPLTYTIRNHIEPK
jgi:hypothetical protein